jgi:hypothetical protein
VANLRIIKLLWEERILKEDILVQHMVLTSPLLLMEPKNFPGKVSKMPFLKGRDLEVQKEFQKNICRSKSLF